MEMHKTDKDTKKYRFSGYNFDRCGLQRNVRNILQENASLPIHTDTNDKNAPTMSYIII